MHRRLPCKLSSRHPLLQFETHQSGVAHSASDPLKLPAPWNGDPVPVCHGARHRNNFNICHGRFQLLPGRDSSSAHKGCLCRAWCDGRAKLLHVMCLGNGWDFRELAHPAPRWNQVPVRSLFPLHPCIIILSSLHLLLRADGTAFHISLKQIFRPLVHEDFLKHHRGFLNLSNQTLVPSWASLEGTATCKVCPCKGHRPVISGCQEAPEGFPAPRCAENMSWEM